MKIVVAMSGGVDSSVAAALLCEQGHEVIGVHMRLHDGEGSGPGHCCGFDDALDARRCADALGIPFYVMNLREEFQRAVIDDLVDTYLDGRTPNPCIRCNAVLKFRVLLDRALDLGASHLATGHYARVVRSEDGVVHLACAVDQAKDQSYFLFPISREALELTLFPLGVMSKPEVREHAARFGLVTANKPESQEICFIPDDDHTSFIRGARPELDGAGDIVDESGQVLGHHDGYYRYTVGQRRGLRVALGTPAYVVRVEPAPHTVVVTTDPARIGHLGMVLRQCTWLARPSPGAMVEVRVRHRGRRIPCRLTDTDPVEVELLEPERAIAPGQAAVFYQGSRVLGGGWIARSIAAPGGAL